MQTSPWSEKQRRAGQAGHFLAAGLAGGEGPGVEEEEGSEGNLGVLSVRAGTTGGGGSTGAGSWQRFCAATAALRRREEGAAGLGRFRRSRGSSLGGSLGVRRAGERKERAARERERN